MSIDIEAVVDVWVAIKSYISSKDRQAAADQIAIVIADYTTDENELRTLRQCDAYLSRAVEDYLDDDTEYEDDEEDGGTD